MTRAAVYLRISMDRTGEQAGVSRQREDCLALVEQQEWSLAQVYVDNDISASSGKARPGYKAMLGDIEAGNIDAVVAWHPDRLYRKLADLEGLIASIERRNVVMRTVRAGEIDLSTPTGRMIARILSATAQGEGEVKADRWRRSWRQGRETGRWAKTGSRLFGYTRSGEVIHAEAEVVREMVDRLLSGDPILTVARWLDDCGVQTTRSSPWTPQGIKRHLTNPVIAGWATLNGDIVTEGDWEPLLSQEDWQSVRAMLTASTRPFAPRVSLLNGLLFCGSCGTRMVTSSQRRTRTYRCPKRPNMPGCGKVSGNAEPIEETVEAYTRARLRDVSVRTKIAALRAEPVDTQEELSNLQVRLAELEQSLEVPGVPVATVLRAIERAKARQADVLNEMAARNLEPLPAEDQWPSDLGRRRALVDLIVGRVELMPAGKPNASRSGFNEERVVIAGRH